MLFHSIAFLVFFPAVAGLYFALPHRFRWVLLLAASYFFYGYWRVEYLLLLGFNTLADYALALRMGACPTRRQRLPYLIATLVLNLGQLAIFKYAAFAGTSLQAVLQYLNAPYYIPIPQLVLPVGISFYIFQTLSYTIDVYRGVRPPEKHLGMLALYISFFPQLVAGPIERSEHLLPQFYEKHTFRSDQVASGLRRMLLGFFKKLVIADQAALIVEAVYANPENFPGPTLLMASYFFAYQVYCDFSGYSDIAVGAARILGFELMENFRRPFSAASIHELWQRWHISLSTWFRDYLYIPLGGNRGSTGRLYLNLLIVFTLSGLWHGAGWNFVLWGALHGFLLVMSLVTRGLRDGLWKHIDAAASRWLSVRTRELRHGLAVFITFHLFILSLIVFRAGSMSNAAAYFHQLLQFDTAGFDLWPVIGPTRLAILLVAIGALELLQYARERYDLPSAWLSVPSPVRWGAYYVSILVILLFGELGAREFYYFQF
jgi:D-alanyl-lipoteichoic acid acyltransferase DltB (MBOAT superfamily)